MLSADGVSYSRADLLRISVEDVLDHAAAEGWLIVPGQRVLPGEVEPELATSARYVPVPNGAQGYY